jgi:hypothetical protein
MFGNWNHVEGPYGDDDINPSIPVTGLSMEFK